MRNRAAVCGFSIEGSALRSGAFQVTIGPARNDRLNTQLLKPTAEPRWTLAPRLPAVVERLSQECGISTLVAQCLVNRGFADPEQASAFLEPRLRMLADPFLLPDMAKAVERLFDARTAGAPLVIFGDYDVDGVTATTVLTDVMTALGWTVHQYLPHRLEEGYGLSQAAVENCLAKFSVGLVLAVDCGSTAVAPIAWLKERAVDVVVLDHHQLTHPLPPAFALVNPQCERLSAKPSTGAPATMPAFGELCSAGLAFKLAHALVKHGRERDLPGFAVFDLKPLLDLVALGTIADLVPLTGENRILVTAGLERLQVTTRPGIVALKAVAQTQGTIGSFEVGFQLAPRLNAAGRLETAHEALQLLLSTDRILASRLATSLDARNRERQAIERAISIEAADAVRARFDPECDFVVVEGRAEWHIGVVGIVASRVLREFYRPTVILGGDGETWRGSGRSIPGFDLAAALRECDDLLIKHGGHAMAAGVSIHPDQVDSFRARLNTLAQQQLTPQLLRPELRLDAEIALSDITMDRVEELDRLRPFGQENPEVRLCVRRVSLARDPLRMGREQQHARLSLYAGGATAECVWWNYAELPMPQGMFDVAVVPAINEYNGRRSLQLKLLDWRVSG